MIKLKLLLTLIFLFSCINNPNEIEILQLENETLHKEIEYLFPFKKLYFGRKWWELF